jgi:hypothetical protein
MFRGNRGIPARFKTHEIGEILMVIEPEKKDPGGHRMKRGDRMTT